MVHRGRRRASDLLILQLQPLVSVVSLWSSGRVASAINHQVIFPVLNFYFNVLVYVMSVSSTKRAP